MKEFIIKNKMLCCNEVINLITTLIHKDVISLIMKEAEESDTKKMAIDRFLMPLGVVRTTLTKGGITKISSICAYNAIDNSKGLPDRCRRLLGPQIEALLEIAPKLDILTDIKYYIDSSLLDYMRNRNNTPMLLEGTVGILDRLDVALETISDSDYEDIMCIFRTAVASITSPLYTSRKWFRAHNYNEYDLIAKVAIDAILNDGSRAWPFYTAEDSNKYIERAITLGYEPSEIWAMKVLLIRRVCSVIHWQFNLSDDNELSEAIDLLKFGYDLNEEVSSYTSKEENKRLYNVAWQMLHLLNSTESEIREACKNNPKAIEQFNKRLDEIFKTSK